MDRWREGFFPSLLITCAGHLLSLLITCAGLGITRCTPLLPLYLLHFIQALDEQLYGETLDHLQVPRDGQPREADQSQSPADQSITTL